MKHAADIPTDAIIFIDDAHTFGGAQIAMASTIRVLLQKTAESIVCVCSKATWKAVLHITGESPRMSFIECPSALPLNLFTFPLRVPAFFFLLRSIKQRDVKAWWLNLSGIEFCLAPRVALALLSVEPSAWLHNEGRFSFFYSHSSASRRALSRVRDFIADHILFRFYRRLVTPSKSSAAEVLERTKHTHRPQVTHMYIPTVAPDLHTPSIEVHADRGSAFDLWMIGRVEYGHKNNQLALGVLSTLIASGADAHLTVVGDGPDMEDFRQRIDTANLTGSVTMLGWQSSPWERVPKSATIFIPSVYESMSLVAREAMVRGLRLVVSPIPVFREWIPHNLIAEDFSPAAFTGKVEEVGQLSRLKLDDFYKNALERFSDELFLESFYLNSHSA